jgi:hypothetical protein
MQTALAKVRAVNAIRMASSLILLGGFGLLIFGRLWPRVSALLIPSPFDVPYINGVTPNWFNPSGTERPLLTVYLPRPQQGRARCQFR